MFCPNCGEEINDDSKFCSSCGNRIESKPPIKKNDEKASNNKKIIIGLALIAIVLAVMTIPLILNSMAQPEIVIPKGFKLESTQSGISTYANDEGYDKIDIQKSSVPSKSYNNENIAVLKTKVNNTDYTITIHGKDFHDSYLRSSASTAQKKIMYMLFDEMISKGHLDSNIDDIQFYGDFEGFEVKYP